MLSCHRLPADLLLNAPNHRTHVYLRMDVQMAIMNLQGKSYSEKQNNQYHAGVAANIRTCAKEAYTLYALANGSYKTPGFRINVIYLSWA